MASQPVSPAQVEREILRISSELERTTDELPVLARRAAEAEVNSKVEHAKALLSSGFKTVGERESDALMLTSDLFMDRKVNAALYEVAVERCRTLRAQLNALQTISANMRAQT